MSTSGELTLPGAADSVPAARSFVRKQLQTWGLGLLTDPLLLIVSELATNAVLHARTSFTVRVRLEAGSVRLEVDDESAVEPRPRTASEAAATGRGLQIVAQLVDEWGVEERPDGKRVWVRLGPPGSRGRPLERTERLDEVARTDRVSGDAADPPPGGPLASVA